MSAHYPDKLTLESLPVEKQIKNWSSSCYCHFKMPVIIVEKGILNINSPVTCKSLVLYLFKCIWFLHRVRSPSLVNVEKIQPQALSAMSNPVRAKLLMSPRATNYAQGSTYNKAKLQYLISHWIFECHWPFAIIDNDVLLQLIFKMLYTKVEMPSATTISWDFKEIYPILKVYVGKILQVCPS